MRKRAAQSKPEIIGEILRKVLKKRNIPITTTDRRLLDLWTRAVGSQIAARTLPDTLKRGHPLRTGLRAPSGCISSSSSRRRSSARSMNSLGKGRDPQPFLLDRQIPSPPPGAADPPPAAPVPAPLRKRDREMMRESLDAVRDPELREILERVMAREISRRREREKRKDP